MATNNLTFEIFNEDYVGDSIGKHNYNALSLDTSICNLSSMLFNDADNIYVTLADLAYNINKFNQTASLFVDPSRYDTCSSATSLLSSYWSQHEFSVHYPINISTINNLAIDAPVYNSPEARLTSLALAYLNANFKANVFTQGTKANVIFFLYNVGINPSDPNNLMHVSFSPEISFVNRYMSASYKRDDAHFTNGKIIKFVQTNGTWVKISSL
jgi:hypothetical protein